ncbi:DUF3168 domain-containing protein [Paenibacillus sp. TRM 82003]|nr:DUF3168 domain-containing protein [Paenibacillus sp. TRM 82003]
MDATDDAQYPYIVYDLPNSVDDGTLENFDLDVDGWSISDDTNVIEDLMSKVDAALHRKSVVVGDLALTIYRENRLTLTDDDRRIKRRKYVYQVRTYYIGG